jgi:predicted PurR-regulated permease PerM
MQPATQVRIWIGILGVGVLILFWLKAILLPFVAGMGIAYLLDPVCDRLESWGCSRTLATSIVTAVFALLVVVLLLMLVPLALDEALAFFTSLPDFLGQLQERLAPFYENLRLRFNLPPVDQLTALAQDRLGSAFAWLGGAIEGVVNQGLALANLLSLIFITPVVTFYLLHDWDRMVARIDGLLPRDHAQTIREQAREMDRTLAGFVRGQSLVCTVLAAYYATGLAFTGLQFGLVIGILAGMLTFVPYLGAMTGLLLALAVALTQFDAWSDVLLVVGVFAVGQVLEGNFLTPKLVGGRIGLHPVWIIFALFAGGATLGFVGLLLAVPLAALIGVLVRFTVSRYMASRLYLGRQSNSGEGEAGRTGGGRA